MNKIIVGAWRDESSGPMQVVSGPIGRERVHSEAPEAKNLEAETKAFFIGTIQVQKLIPF